MDVVEWVWLHDENSLKEGLQKALHCSGQLLKKHFSSKELDRPQRAGGNVRLPMDLVNNLQINPIFEGAGIRILKETPNYLAVHKPPGIHSHPLRYRDKNTVLNFLAAQNKWEALRVNEQSYDRGLLYRLDVETSGVLLIAKNGEFFNKYREGFHKEMRRKLYWAVVEGDFDQEGEWAHYFRPIGTRGSKQTVSTERLPSSQEGKFKVIKLLVENGRSLLLIDLKSGLRHQIRAQLAALGFSILGDTLYGGAPHERLCLHAWRYEWEEAVQDDEADLFFFSLFDRDRALKMSHDVLRSL